MSASTGTAAVQLTEYWVNKLFVHLYVVLRVECGLAEMNWTKKQNVSFYIKLD